MASEKHEGVDITTTRCGTKKIMSNANYSWRYTACVPISLQRSTLFTFAPVFTYLWHLQIHVIVYFPCSNVDQTFELATGISQMIFRAFHITAHYVHNHVWLSVEDKLKQAI